MSIQTISSIPLYKSPCLTNLSRIHNSIYGFDLYEQIFVQVDTKHSIVWTYNIPIKGTNPLIDCKYFGSCKIGDQIREGYICCFDKVIIKYSFLDKQKSENNKCTLLTSNSLASFTGIFDAYENSLICMKLHENHGKFSLNWLFGQKQKKIVKLMDFNPKSLYLNRHNPQVIYTDPQNQVRYFDIHKPENQSLLVKKSTVLFDNDYLYCTSANLVSKFNDVYEIQALDLKTGKHSFAFRGTQLPKKIENFGFYLFYLTERSFAIYDKRKNEPVANFDFQTEAVTKSSNQRINDFMIDPNLGRIYLSLTNELKIINFNFF